MAKKWISVICVWIISFTILLTPLTARGQNESANESTQENSGQQTESADLIQAPSGVLMEAQTGTVIYQKDSDTRRSPASITKIMTLILIFDALEKGNLKLDDIVTTSAYAKSMGGRRYVSHARNTTSIPSRYSFHSFN